MKKLKLFATVLALAASAGAFAQDYNRVGVSYNNTHFGVKGDSDENLNLNGIGIDYIHGFTLTSDLPLFLETGAKFNFGFKSDSETYNSIKYTSKFNLITISVPVNIAYSYNVNEDFAIKPYAGLNFKLHLSGTMKDITERNGQKDEDKYNIFKKEDCDPTWKRFQMGWHIGVGFQYKPLYLGISWGTDFIKPVEDINSSNLSVALGYNF